MERIEEMKLDVAELESLAEKATRRKVKDLLTIEARKIVTQIVALEESSKKEQIATTTTTTSNQKKTYKVKLNTYAWDQSNKFVKFYVTLKNVQNIAAENVSCTFTEKSLEMNVKDLDGKDYIFNINNLLKTIDPATSSWKVKTDTVLINAAKVENVSWSHVTELEKRANDAKNPPVPDISKSGDPTEGLMSFMKNMYEQGDDEMKRTIAKAWTQGQNKMPSF